LSAVGNTGTSEWLRRCSLIVSDAAGNGLDLSQLHIQFKVGQSDLETPNNAYIRVYNLSEKTSKQIQKEFTQVTLQAGYVNGAFGIIHSGTIKQIRRGKFNNMDTYLDIMAADTDIGLNFGVVNKTLAAGAKPSDQAQVYANAMQAPIGFQQYGVGDVALIRGKVMYGMARDGMRNLARSTGTTWSVQNGKVVVIPLTGYLPSEAVVLNSRTGLIGLPEQTQEGISATCLLNPKIQIGTQVQINNADIQRAQVNIDYTAFNVFPSIADDGFYRVLVCEHEGDTRGQPWYSKLVCLTVNPTVAPNKAVQPYG